jgi:hypothetical protein
MKTTAASIFNSNNLIDAIQNEEILWNTIQAAAEEEKRAGVAEGCGYVWNY